MKRLNVLPVELSGVKLPWWRYDPSFLLGLRGCGALLIGLLLLLMIQRSQIFFYERLYEAKKNTQKKMQLLLSEEERKASLIRTSLESLTEEQGFLDKKLDFLEHYQAGGPVWSQVLADLSQLFTKRVQLKRFAGTEKMVTVQGVAPDHRSINALIGAISENPLGKMEKGSRFQNVRLNFTEVEKNEGLDTFRFEIAADVA